MFGINKDHLIKSLCRLSCQLCAYIGPMCDCKYMKNSDEFIATGSEAGSGCPETAMAAVLISAMTPDEFATIAKRAGIHISDEAQATPDVVETLRKFKNQRRETMRAHK